MAPVAPKAEPIGPPKEPKDGKKMPEGAAIMPVNPDAGVAAPRNDGSKPVINSEVPF